MSKKVSFSSIPKGCKEESFGYLDFARVWEERDANGDVTRVVEGVATTADTVDLNGVEVTASALRSAERDLLQMSTVLVNHDLTRPVGRVLDSRYDAERKALIVKAMISSTEDEVWRKIQEGILNKFSVSWRTLEWDEEFDEEAKMPKFVVRSLRLKELSVVSVPADPNAEFTQWVRSALDTAIQHTPQPTQGDSPADSGEEESESRGDVDSLSRATVIEFSRTTAAPKDRRWDAAAAVRRIRRWAGGPKKSNIDWQKYSKAFAYVENDGTRYGDYKFPHHDVIGGKFVSVFRGVTTAAGRLANWDANAEAKKGVARHLLQEYRKVHDGAEVPESLLGLAGEDAE